MIYRGIPAQYGSVPKPHSLSIYLPESPKMFVSMPGDLDGQGTSRQKETQ
jgi:hypothetical protein